MGVYLHYSWMPCSSFVFCVFIEYYGIKLNIVWWILIYESRDASKGPSRKAHLEIVILPQISAMCLKAHILKFSSSQRSTPVKLLFHNKP